MSLVNVQRGQTIDKSIYIMYNASPQIKIPDEEGAQK